MSDNNYNLKLAALWESKFGNGYYSLQVDDQVYDALQSIERGGRLIVKVLGEESRKKETSPHAYLEFMSKEKVDSGKGGSKSSAPKKAARKTATDDDDDGGI